jgi:hypothetical protein
MASAAAMETIDAYFDRCASAQKLRPTGCPNWTLQVGDHQSRVRWALTNDPFATVKLSNESTGGLVATGVWMMHVSFDYWLDARSGRVKRWDQDIAGDFSDTMIWNGVGFDVTKSTGAITARANGISSLPPPSITAVAQGINAAGSRLWLVVGRYFTPGLGVAAYLYVPYDAKTSVSSNKPGLSVRADGTFSRSFELYTPSRRVTATIKACDDANVCATVVVTTP